MRSSTVGVCFFFSNRFLSHLLGSGASHSYEKEHFDLMRAAFIKYGFQSRIGGMSGVFVAYHNLKSIFGYQFLPQSVLDSVFLPPSEPKVDAEEDGNEPETSAEEVRNARPIEELLQESSDRGELVFRSSTSLLQSILRHVTEHVKGANFSASRHVTEPDVSTTLNSRPYREHDLKVPAFAMTLNRSSTSDSTQSTLHVYLEMPCVEEDPQEFLPFFQRRSTIFMLDSMSVEEIDR